ncbi:MAG: hypothetical protein KBD06_02630 [Candidatus Pacebacteria bacterium]|nr:hypothetical protein [Candidatus Paceibacterota bacterium]
MEYDDYERVALEWLEAQTDVPEGAKMSGLNLREGSCSFKVHAFIPNSAIEVHIFSVTIRSDGTVRAQDRRHVYREMLEDKSFGIRREERVLSLLAAPGGMKPYWYVAVERTVARMDRRGVDLFVRVMLTETETCKIPVQIKSSQAALDCYYAENPTYQDIVAGFVVRDAYSDEYLLELFFAELDKFRKHYACMSVVEVKALITSALYPKRAA